MLAIWPWLLQRGTQYREKESVRMSLSNALLFVVETGACVTSNILKDCVYLGVEG